MLSKEIYNRVLSYYDEYKKEYNKKNLIGIIPYECDDDTMLAYTSNEELMDCIKNGLDVTLYVSPKFMLCPEQYVKAVFFMSLHILVMHITLLNMMILIF